MKEFIQSTNYGYKWDILTIVQIVKIYLLIFLMEVIFATRSKHEKNHFEFNFIEEVVEYSP